MFSDALAEWCEAGYDFIGAPLGPVTTEAIDYCARGYWPVWARFGWIRRALGLRTLSLLNGGLSLRRIPKLRAVARRHRKQVELWGRNEDLFWSAGMRAHVPFIRFPEEDVAARFSLMTDVKVWLEKLDGELPFGCHGWPKYETAEWRKHIPALATELRC